ncbi:hypothetical protein SELMODRAFT_416724 [Selaginella moellendorffii]|uniref:F-box domain-containing protein n=1 Tax=Selaginella moellendorffii TaxID=88036 RepID=D8S075_SELML|nr:hypothetical protein SELMODRAFT_416724 [Selaginella moellendorffii]
MERNSIKNAKNVKCAIDQLPDEVLAEILSRVSNKCGEDGNYAGYCLVCKRWNGVGKKVGLDVSIDLSPLLYKELQAWQGMRLKLGRIRTLTIDKYHWHLHNDYSWLAGLSKCLEEITIDGGPLELVEHFFDLECLSKCSKLKYMSLARVDVRKVNYGDRKLAVSFPALTCCILERVTGINLQQLLGSCPRLERLEAEMYAFNGLLCSASLRELRLEAEAGGDFELDFPDLEAAFVGDCMKLELKAPRFKRLSLGCCQELVSLDVGSPLQSLELYSSSGFRTAAAVDKRHFECLRLKTHGSVTGGYCAHKVAKEILVLPQMRECKELSISGCRCHLWKCSKTDQLVYRHERAVSISYKLRKVCIEDNKDSVLGRELEEMLATLVKQCPALEALEVAGAPDEQLLSKLRVSSSSTPHSRQECLDTGVQSRRCLDTQVHVSKLRIRLLRDSTPEAISCD